jgi:membrane-associated phospholipid phosphatase
MTLELPVVVRSSSRPLKWLLYPAIFIPYIIAYQVINRFPIFPPHSLPFTWGDDLIPFIPSLLPVYVLYIPFFWWTGVRSENSETLNRFVYATYLQLIVCSLIWLMFPVRMPRELFYTTDSYNWADTFWRWFDEPNNCFPSLHAANGLLFIQFNWRRSFRGVATVVAIAIIASTVFVKQHYVVDVLAGGLVYLLTAKFLRAVRIRPDCRRLAVDQECGAATASKM